MTSVFIHLAAGRLASGLMTLGNNVGFIVLICFTFLSTDSHTFYFFDFPEIVFYLTS